MRLLCYGLSEAAPDGGLGPAGTGLEFRGPWYAFGGPEVAPRGLWHAFGEPEGEVGGSNGRPQPPHQDQHPQSHSGTHVNN